jgi:formamidopyrimidine-DNA glycosylase
VTGLFRDQRQVAGIGNAYSDEILHAARMSPLTLTLSLATDDLARLYGVIGEVLRQALADRRMSRLLR